MTHFARSGLAGHCCRRCSTRAAAWDCNATTGGVQAASYTRCAAAPDSVLRSCRRVCCRISGNGTGLISSASPSQTVQDAAIAPAATQFNHGTSPDAPAYLRPIGSPAALLNSHHERPTTTALQPPHPARRNRHRRPATAAGQSRAGYRCRYGSPAGLSIWAPPASAGSPICDHGRVDDTNLQRQIAHSSASIGCNKG